MSEAATRLFEAAERGFWAPARPEQGATLAARLRYRRDRCLYRIKKMATDWLAVILATGVAFLAFIAIGVFVLITHGPL